MTIIPEHVFGTGGVESAAGAALDSMQSEFVSQCMYCLDAPNMIPAGSTKTRTMAQEKGQLNYAGPTLTYRE